MGFLTSGEMSGAILWFMMQEIWRFFGYSITQVRKAPWFKSIFFYFWSFRDSLHVECEFFLEPASEYDANEAKVAGSIPVLSTAPHRERLSAGCTSARVQLSSESVVGHKGPQVREKEFLMRIHHPQTVAEIFA